MFYTMHTTSSGVETVQNCKLVRKTGVCMMYYQGQGQPVDVICQHCRDGTIILMKVRIRDEEGMYQSYAIKGYKKISGDGYTMPNGVYVKATTQTFECKILTFGRERIIHLYYKSVEQGWVMAT